MVMMSISARRGHGPLPPLMFSTTGSKTSTTSWKRPDTPTTTYMTQKMHRTRPVCRLSPIVSPFVPQTLSAASSPCSSPTSPFPPTPSSLSVTGFPLSATLFRHAMALPPTPPVRKRVGRHNDDEDEVDDDEDRGPLSPQSIRHLQTLAFSSLGPVDIPYIKAASRLLDLRDSDPQHCLQEAKALCNDVSAPRCWRARAGIYIAESLWKLGYREAAKEQLDQVEAWFMAGEPDSRYNVLETLVKLNLHMGQLNWGGDSPSQFINPPKENTLNPAVVFT